MNDMHLALDTEKAATGALCDPPCQSCQEWIDRCENMAKQTPLSRKELAESLRNTIRQGAETDSPEGVRYIALSDTLANMVANALETSPDAKGLYYWSQETRPGWQPENEMTLEELLEAKIPFGGMGAFSSMPSDGDPSCASPAQREACRIWNAKLLEHATDKQV